MAATNGTSSPTKGWDWYSEDVTEVNKPIRILLERYARIPCDEVVRHVNTIREKGFAVNPYPCIGLYRFTQLTLLTHPLYHSIVERLKQEGTSYLDIGCCFGQDLRQLILDGVPPEHLTGLDIESALMNIGYDFFRDREMLKSRFVVADIFKGPSQGPTWTDLEERGMDVIHCSAFFHLFQLDQQIAAAKQVARLVKVAGVIVGRQMGSVKPGDVTATKVNSTSYRHSVETFDEMWQKVGEATSTRWTVEGTLDMVGIKPDSRVEDGNSRRLLFTVRRVA